MMDKATKQWIKSSIALKKKPDGWFTIDEVCGITGDTCRTVFDRLAKMVKAGELEVGKFSVNGRLKNAYRKIDNRKSAK